jgi:hypothetical protein
MEPRSARGTAPKVTRTTFSSAASRIEGRHLIEALAERLKLPRRLAAWRALASYDTFP